MSDSAPTPADFAAPGGWTAPGKEPRVDCNGSRGLVGVGGVCHGIPQNKGEKRCQAVGGNAEGKVPTTAPACANEAARSNTAPGGSSIDRILRAGLVAAMDEVKRCEARTGGGGAELGDENGAQKSGAVPPIVRVSDSPEETL